MPRTVTRFSTSCRGPLSPRGRPAGYPPTSALSSPRTRPGWGCLTHTHPHTHTPARRARLRRAGLQPLRRQSVPPVPRRRPPRRCCRRPAAIPRSLAAPTTRRLRGRRREGSAPVGKPEWLRPGRETGIETRRVPRQREEERERPVPGIPGAGKLPSPALGTCEPPGFGERPALPTVCGRRLLLRARRGEKGDQKAGGRVPGFSVGKRLPFDFVIHLRQRPARVHPLQLSVSSETCSAACCTLRKSPRKFKRRCLAG